MTSDRQGIRGTVLVEDKRTERFFRNLLDLLGFDTEYKFKFKPAPSGRGDAAAWVRAQYPPEVRILRQKRNQRLAVVAVRDGNSVGVERRVNDLDEALVETSLEKRQANERIATPVPTWSIETWLLALAGDDDVDESASLKQNYEHRFRGKEERKVIREAARAWLHNSKEWNYVPSLRDGKEQMKILDLP